MQRKHCRRQPGPRNFQPCQHPPPQHRAGRVQKHVGEMIAQGVLPPQPPFQPQSRGAKREVIRRCRGPPKLAQPVGRLDQGVVGQKNIIVPNEAGVPDRLISEQRCGHQQQTVKPIPARKAAPKFHRAARGLSRRDACPPAGFGRQFAACAFATCRWDAQAIPAWVSRFKSHS